MAKMFSDEKIGKLKTSVEYYRNLLQRQIQIKEEENLALKEEVAMQNAEWQKKYREKEKKLAGLEEVRKKFQDELDDIKHGAKEEIQIKEDEINHLGQEIKMEKKEAKGRHEVLEVAMKASNTENKNLEKKLSILQKRHTEEQQRWAETFKNKEKDIEILKGELGQRAKDWENESKREEEIIDIIREEKRKLEQEIGELKAGLKAQETKTSEQMEMKDGEIAALREELALREQEWKTKSAEKDHDIDALRREMEEEVKQMTGGEGIEEEPYEITEGKEGAEAEEVAEAEIQPEGQPEEQSEDNEKEESELKTNGKSRKREKT